MSGTAGLFLPIAFALGAALLLVAIVRRYFTARTAERFEAEAVLSGHVGSESNRDAKLPRWLDPAVAAVRFRTDTTTAARAAIATAVAAPAARLPVVFSGPIDGLAVRLVIRYDSVPLLDGPDDALGRTREELDAGDEVELLERLEIWSQVRTPSGASGWVPNMTLATAFAATAEADLNAPDLREPELDTPADEPPPLEALLEAIVAQRLARQELADGLDPKAAMHVDAAPAVPGPSRPRKSKGDAAPPAGAEPATAKVIPARRGGRRPQGKAAVQPPPATGESRASSRGSRGRSRSPSPD
jgi:SH3-like domain-containing protein